MVFTWKRYRRNEFSRSLMDVLKSLYTFRCREDSQNARVNEDTFNSEKRSRSRETHTHWDQALSRSHPIRRLPNELVAHIFVLGAEDDVMLPMVLSHVCRAWRCLALHTPALWRRITLDHRLHLWARRIHRSKTCTLDIELLPPPLPSNGFNRVPSHDARVVQYYMQLVDPLIHRWRSFEVRFDTYAPHLWNAALSACRDTPEAQAPFLQELTLVYRGNDDSTEFVLFNGVAPRLRRATLCGIRLAWLPSLFENLVFLDYTHHGFTRSLEAAAEVLNMLQVSCHLQELRIAFPWRGDSIARYPTPAPRSVSLAQLHTLTISVEGPDIPCALWLVLSRLSLPAVRILRLRSRYPFRRPTIFPRLHYVLRDLPPMPSVDYLYLEHGWLDTHFVFPLLLGLPRLEHLCLHGPRVTEPFLSGLAETVSRRRINGGTTVYLKLLELVRCDSLLADDLIRVVQSRSGVGAIALYIRECDGVDFAALRRLRPYGVTIKLWTYGQT
ncbi:uncharacterized protein LAESUDRAFT_647525 [Laetiporus sulphureus 93-53]|uniref:F-box domain-containing protein n=1 Tax=Laetiporus sulphureus 93-53 TaxID=1314785 RepID=A0A165FQ43_9APHY|nr:uncharacterized protein LAESUDRAFT_647525 [Laetiporus sulphureus 93-53]KZT09306.1 hypothetical protein LAESUDRAFT_647525 [Laetiporus sulphureus 93-53]